MQSTHPVAALIRRRASEGSRPGARSDPHRLALVVEGGGMRGVVTAGMVSALEYLGLTEVFDDAYGASAGTVTAGFFVAGQAEYGTTIFAECLTGRRFVDRRRVVLPGSVMDLEYLLDDVMENIRPLDYDAVLHSAIPLHVIATNLDRNRAVELPRAQTKQELRLQFHAATVIPVAAGSAVTIDGERFCDAGIWDSIPFAFAEQDGATHVLVLQSRPMDSPRPGQHRLEKMIAARHFGRIAPEVLEPYRTRVERYNEDCERLAALSLDVDRSPSLLAIRPERGAPVIQLFERRRERVVAGALSGFHSMTEALLGIRPDLIELLTPMRDGRRDGLRAGDDGGLRRTGAGT